MPRGGKREGAGRKPKWVETMRASTADKLLQAIGEKSAWLWCYAQAVAQLDTMTVFRILSYLTDRRDGKAAQQMNLTVRQVGGFTAQELERARELVKEIQAGYDAPILQAETVYLPKLVSTGGAEVVHIEDETTMPPDSAGSPKDAPKPS